jgi:hypothetical protein
MRVTSYYTMKKTFAQCIYLPCRHRRKKNNGISLSYSELRIFAPSAIPEEHQNLFRDKDIFFNG